MRVDLQDVPERILAVDHLVRLLAGEVFVDVTALLAAVGHDLLRQALDVGVGDAEVEDTGLPEFEVVLPPLGVGELKELDADRNFMLKFANALLIANRRRRLRK